MEHKLNTFKDIIKQTSILCQKPPLTTYSACTSTLTILQKLQPAIEEQDNSFKDLVGHRRPKRALFDAVGKIFKLFIGTLDTDDANFYNDAIMNYH